MPRSSSSTEVDRAYEAGIGGRRVVVRFFALTLPSTTGTGDSFGSASRPASACSCARMASSSCSLMPRCTSKSAKPPSRVADRYLMTSSCGTSSARSLRVTKRGASGM